MCQWLGSQCSNNHWFVSYFCSMIYGKTKKNHGASLFSKEMLIFLKGKLCLVSNFRYCVKILTGMLVLGWYQTLDTDNLISARYLSPEQTPQLEVFKASDRSYWRAISSDFWQNHPYIGLKILPTPKYININVILNPRYWRYIDINILYCPDLNSCHRGLNYPE